MFSLFPLNKTLKASAKTNQQLCLQFIQIILILREENNQKEKGEES